MKVFGANKKKKKAAVPASPVAESLSKQGSPVVRWSRGCCGGLDCMGSMVSTSQHDMSNHGGHHPPAFESDQQVADLEREIQKQRELRMLYRKRMERTQDYLKYCLQIAQDNGFLQLIVNPTKSTPQQPLCLPSPNSLCNNVIGDATPLFPLPQPQHHSDLAPVIEQAKMNGWFIEPDEIKLGDKVAQGSTAEIYKATWRGLDVAVKCLFPDFFHANQSSVAFFAQELETLSRQRHRFVLLLMGACLDPPNQAWIVTDFLEMTLKEWLHGSGNRQMARSVPLPPLDERVRTALEIAQAMQYLHEQKPKVIHRDLKPSNIFLDDGMHVQVADFGHARFLRNKELALTGETGTYVYMAPEVIRCEPYDEKCDVYSFAIILNELITGNHPYIETEYGPSKIALEVGEGKLRPALPEDDNGQFEDLIQLITHCWDQDPSVRPPFSTITRDLRKFQQNLTENA